MKRWSKKVKSAGGCVFKLDKLIVPVNVSNSRWCLAVAHVRERRLQYYDSMVLQGEAKKYNGDAGVDVANWEVVPTQVWGPRRCGPMQGSCSPRSRTTVMTAASSPASFLTTSRRLCPSSSLRPLP